MLMTVGISFFGAGKLGVRPRAVEQAILNPPKRIEVTSTPKAPTTTPTDPNTPIVKSKMWESGNVRIRPDGTRKNFPNKTPYPQPTPSPIPAPTGQTRDVTLTIGNLSGKTQHRLGVNIGELTAYSQNNLTSNMLTQIGTFERANGVIMLHAGSGSTTTQLRIKDPWLFNHLGVGVLVGAKLESVNGPNNGGTSTITAASIQTDNNGNQYVAVTLSQPLSKTANSGDSFVATILNYNDTKFADNIYKSGNVTLTRENGLGHGGASSAKLAFGSGAASSNIIQLQNYYGADTTAGRNVLRQGHVYEISFWARVAPGGGAVTSKLSLYQGKNGGTSQHTLIADGQWHKYTTTVDASNPVVYENGQASFYFSGSNATVYVDDLQIVDTTDQLPGAPNLSKDVATLIKNHNFGELRFWQPLLRAARFDDIIGKAEDRPSVLNLFDTYDPQFGLPEMLELCRQTNTTPWITLTTAWTTQDLQNLMEYLAGDVNTTYGAKRAADGQVTPWTDVLAGIRLEAGNESWNGTFYPYAFYPFERYFETAQDMFTDIKSTSYYGANANKIELIVNGWQWVPWYTEQAVKNVPAADAVSVSTYLSGPNYDMATKDFYGAVLSQQLNDNPAQYPKSIFGKKVYVYEMNAGELQQQVPLARESEYATSLAAGLAVARESMVLSRDYGMTSQNLFTFIQRGNNLPAGYALGHYGIFTDLTTAFTNPRPVALAAQLLNNASGDIVSSSISGGWQVDANSTWATAKTTSANDAMVTLDGNKLVITFFNNTATEDTNARLNVTLPTTIGGRTITPDWANISMQLLSGPAVNSTNESAATVGISAGQFTVSNRLLTAMLPAHSMASITIPLF